MPEVVLVTGARKGIGRYLAEHFLAKGANVEGCSRGESELTHENYTHHSLDVTDEGSVKLMMRHILSRFGRLDILINSAGIASMNHILLSPVSTVDRIMATNFKGTFITCREAVKIMQRRKYGRIVNLSSIAVPLNLEGEAIYAASKSAVTTFSQILAREVASLGITCNVIGPTPTATDLIRNVPQRKIDAIVDRLAIKRLGKFEDVGNVVDFFVKPESDYITGQTVYLGGVS